MNCPRCGSGWTDVKETRDTPKWRALQLHWPGRGIWRLRSCLDCAHQWGTREYVWPPPKDSSSATGSFQ